MGTYILQMNYPVRAKEAIDPIIDRALKLNYKRRLPLIYGILGQHSLEVEEDFPATFHHLEQALKISEETHDILSLFVTNYSLGFSLLCDCAFEKASHHFEKGLEINQAANNLWGISAMKSFLTLIQLYRGQIDLGHQLSAEALHLAEDSGDIYSKGIAYTAHGVSCYCKGFLAEAENHLLKGNDFCERIHFFAWNLVAQYHLGELYHFLGKYEKAVGCFEKGVSCLEEARFGPSRKNINRMGIARARVLIDRGDINLGLLYGYIRENKLKELDGRMRRFMAEILLHLDDDHMDEAESWINQAIEADQRNQMRWCLAWDYLSHSDLLKKKGDRFKATEILGRAIETFKNCGADGWVQETEQKLALIS